MYSRRIGTHKKDKPTTYRVDGQESVPADAHVRRPAIHRRVPLASPAPRSVDFGVKVSVVMPTYRPSFCALAIELFMEQTYANTELVIVRHAVDVEIPDLPNIVVLDASIETPLGRLRQMGDLAATGDYIMRCDDDDYNGPNRIALQLEALLAHPEADAATLKRRIHLDLESSESFVYVASKPIASTLMYRRSPDLRYNRLPRSEDYAFLEENFKNVLAVDLPACESVRVHHGGNIWPKKTIMSTALRRKTIGRADVQVVRTVLARMKGPWRQNQQEGLKKRGAPKSAPRREGPRTVGVAQRPRTLRAEAQWMRRKP